jgi:hypothetical protein
MIEVRFAQLNEEKEPKSEELQDRGLTFDTLESKCSHHPNIIANLAFFWPNKLDRKSGEY